MTLKILRLTLIGVLMTASSLLPAIEIVVLTDKQSRFQQQFIESFSTELAKRDDVHLRTIDEIPLAGLGAETAFVVTLGREMAERFGEDGQMPILHALISSKSYQELQATDSKHHTALFLDQPQERHLNLMTLSMPDRDRIGVLLSHSESKINQLNHVIERSGKQAQFVKLKNVELDLYDGLQRLEQQSDLLWLLPDPNIVNRTQIRTLIRESLRLGFPLVGYSYALVKAGALLAVYSTPEDQGQEAAEMVNTYLNTSFIPQRRYPQRYRVAVNYHMARLMDITIDAESSLLEELQRLESQR